MPAAFAVLAAVAGLLAAVQAGTNGALGKVIDPVPAGLVSFLLSGVCMYAVALAFGQVHWPGLDKAAAAPWWAWAGGLLGAVVVSAQLYAAQPLGSAVFAAIFVTSSVVASLTLDHFGLVGFEKHGISWMRTGGAALMVAGVVLVSRG